MGKRPLVKSYAQKMQSLADTMEEIARKILQSIPDKIQEASLLQLATALGILVDKMVLLRSQPTEHTRHGFSHRSDEELQREMAGLQ